MVQYQRVALLTGLLTALIGAVGTAQASQEQDIQTVLASDTVDVSLDQDLDLFSTLEAAEPEAAAEPEIIAADVSTSASVLLQSPESEATELALSLEPAEAADIDTEAVEVAQVTRRAYRGMPPAYIGIGGNLGIGDSDTALSDMGFAVISKISLGPRFALRPGAIIAEDGTSFTIPLTYNFNVYEFRNFRFQPFVGAGVDLPTQGDVALLIDAGVDIPISREFTLNATTNFRVTDDFGFGLVLGVGYNFPWIFE